MRYAIRWFIRNPVAANLAMAFILFLGLVTLNGMRIEGFPRVPPEAVSITIAFPDATSQQVDAQVTRRVERALEGLDGVRSITAHSSAETSVVVVRRRGDQELQALLEAVRRRLSQIDDLPAAARRPLIESDAFDFPALYINLHGATDPTTLQVLSERLRDALLSEPALSRLKIWGLHEREMRIEIAPHDLERLDLSLADIVRLIKANSLDFQAGSLRTAGGVIALRADDKAAFATQFATLPIVERADGTAIRLGDLAEIRDTVREGEYLFRFNGEATTGMEILVGRKENLLQISDVVHRVAERFRENLPAGVEVSIWGDSTDYISERLDLLRLSGVQGLALVILMLSLFLNLRLAFWVAMGIPVAVMGALAVTGSRWADQSLNDVTTFGLIIALGILVDDAVVVGESVFESRRRHRDPVRGTQIGVERVAVATIFGVLTTIAALFPMLLLDNPLGKVLAGFSGIVIAALVFSLIESKFILPAHLAALRIDDHRPGPPARLWGYVQDLCRAGLERVRDGVYAPLLVQAVRHRYATVLLFVALGALGIGLIGLGKIKTVFFPDVPGQIVTISLEMDARAPFALTRDNIERIRSLGEDLGDELRHDKALARSPIRTMFVVVPDAGSAQIFAELTPVAERPEVDILEIVRLWRARTGAVEGATELRFSGSEEIAGGFGFQLLSRDPAALRDAGARLRRFLGGIEGVHNIRESLTTSQPQLTLRLTPEAGSLGFDTRLLAAQIGYAFGGAEAQKIQRDGREVRVLVRNAPAARDAIDDLLASRVRSRTGQWVPLRSIAEISSGYVAGEIHRRNGRLVNTVAASIDRLRVAPEEIGQAVREQFAPMLRRHHPGVDLRPAGELEEMAEIQDGLQRALLIALVLIYVLMAVPLRSYAQPLLILAIVPFGFVGAAAGHLIMDLKLSLFSFFGMLALSGVVINDSLVMLTRYNQARQSGLAVAPALHEAGVGRFRAIFLTTATTVVGLVPLLMERSEQAQYLIPAAASLAFGELFATGLLLLLMPALIAVAEDIRNLARNVTRREENHARS